MCGISSGSNVAAALLLAKKLGKGKIVVTILPDSGERYFLQTEDWYKEINAEHAKQIMQNAQEELPSSFEWK